MAIGTPDLESDTTAAPLSTAVAPAALKGWAAFQFAVNKGLPSSLSRASKIRTAALRVLRDG